MNMEDRIKDQIAKWAMIGHPDLMSRFILRNGQSFPEVGAWDMPFMTPKECFENAMHGTYLVKRARYVEGYMHRGDWGLLIHHAWIESHGKVLDPTIRDSADCQYFGVPFDRNVAWDRVTETGHFGLFDTGIGVDLTFMCRVDTGMAQEVETACADAARAQAKIMQLHVDHPPE